MYFKAMNDNASVHCTLCEQPIPAYHRNFNHLQIDATHDIDICRSCLDKIIKWQQQNYAKLFPTAASKKFIERRSNRR